MSKTFTERFDTIDAKLDKIIEMLEKREPKVQWISPAEPFVDARGQRA